MYMKSACFRRVAYITKLTRLFHNLIPPNHIQMIIQCGRVTDYLKAVVERTVALAVDVDTALIAGIHNLRCMVVNFTAVVDFKLHAVMRLTAAVEDRVGLIAVVCNKLIFVIVAVLVIVITIITISVTSAVMRVVFMYNGVALNTAHIVRVKTM